VKKLVMLGLIVGAIVVLAKIVAANKAKWEGLTESEIRDKLERRLPKRMPGEKRTAVADKVVSKMRETGALLEEEEPSVSAPTDSGREEDQPEVSGDITASV
jgi:hypothetical protein